ncbi:hypothetical protein AJ79_05473 [Helicocarpus griseus UAMH5409]|uniref:Uncharacterized protein n=1 Tax=Helicocarpus griseus UAMH5409 TaxID=1447875 RepID=A0A2B7XNN9_9EURO|nr:hypothetical protein AJ79_05473 [Helicocarpus griseus UAMH5409]
MASTFSRLRLRLPKLSLILLLLAVFLAPIVLTIPSPHDPTPFSFQNPEVFPDQHPQALETRNFSVAFSLQSSYTAAAVIFTNDDGTLETVTDALQGGTSYRKVMAKLSLYSSQHNAPPYTNEQQYWTDIPRRIRRALRKKSGLPASREVGVLGRQIRKLRRKIESDLSIRVKDAPIAVQHLVALYQDDVEDVAHYAGIEYSEPSGLFHPVLWESGSAYSGYGFGFCKNYTDEEQCRAEDIDRPRIRVFAVHYSRAALGVSMVEVSSGVHPWEPDYRHNENFTLGADAVDSYSSDIDYWADVKAALLDIMVPWTILKKPEKILLTGDMVRGEKFMHVLKTTVEGHLGYVPPIYSDDATVVVAKGAAEMRRRGRQPIVRGYGLEGLSSD